MSIFKTQVGGSHYTRLKIQPVQYAMANGYDGCALNIAKYLMRHEHKNGLQDLEKALHFVDLRLECDWPHHPVMLKISVPELAEANGYDIQGQLCRALLELALFAQASNQGQRERFSKHLKAAIHDVILDYKIKHPVKPDGLVFTGYGTGIRVGPDVSFSGDQDKRQDVLGQNGNEGEHYERS